MAIYSHGVYFFISFLSLESPSKTMDNRPSQAFLHALFLYRIPAPSLLLLSVGCCVVSANGGRLKLMLYPSLDFFVALFAAQNDRNSPPNAFRLGRVSSPTPLPPPQLTFVWLLCLLTKRRPSKTCAPPFLNFSMCAIGEPQAPIKGSRRSEPDPGRQRRKRRLGGGDG